jgi:hypothetical protein
MTIRRPAVLGLCLSCLAGAPAPTVAPQDPPAQSMSDLRQEIERLRQDVAQRDAELAAAKERVARLEKEIADLKARSAGGASAQPDVPPPASVPPPVPADPSIGPGGLLAAMQARYLADFPTMPDTSSPQKLNLHLRALEGWCARTNRDGVKQQSWTGRIDPAGFTSNGRTCSFTALFVNGTREFRVPLSLDQGVLSRIRDGSGAPARGDVVFNAIVKPRVRVNPDRPSPEAFLHPPMLAPYVEFVFDLDVRSVVPPPAQQ